MVEPHAGVERHDSRSGFVIMRTEAIRPAVVGVKSGMSLKDEVHLPGEPEARAAEMWEHRFGIGTGMARRAGGIVRTHRRSIALGQKCTGRLRVRRNYAGRRDHQPQHGQQRPYSPVCRFAISLQHLAPNSNLSVCAQSGDDAEESSKSKKDSPEPPKAVLINPPG